MKPLLIVDGYNVIGAWPEAERRRWTIEESRDHLLHILQDYGGYTGEDIVLVFDGYMSDRKTRSVECLGPVTVVFTRHAETADSYIERLVAETPRYRTVRVATSDGLEQSQVLATGATRLTARELLRELLETRQAGAQSRLVRSVQSGKNIEAQLPGPLLEQLERIRRS